MEKVRCDEGEDVCVESGSGVAGDRKIDQSVVRGGGNVAAKGYKPAAPPPPTQTPLQAWIRGEKVKLERIITHW